VSLRIVRLAITLSLVVSGTAFADDPAKEFWPEFDAWWRTSPAWRLLSIRPRSGSTPRLFTAA